MNETRDAGDGDAASEVVFRSSQIDAFDGEIGAALDRTRTRPKGSDARIRAHGAGVQASRGPALIA